MTVNTQLEAALGAGRVKYDEPLARYTTFKVGGPAQYFFVASSSDQLQLAYKTAHDLNIPVTILGGGSNILISDEGIKGLVVRNEARGIKIVKRLGKIKSGKMNITQVLVEADTGTVINQLVRFTCDEGLSGVEHHLGLPGTIGGALYMNSKWTNPTSYIGDAVYQAKILNPDGTVRLVDQKYFDFAYDYSVLQKTHEIVLSVFFLLQIKDSKDLWKVAHASMEYRTKTQPMGVQTAGCTFRNIATSDAERIITPNRTKSAGYLIDSVGLKGHQIGNAKISDKHANFILNMGGASASDIKALIDLAVTKVKERYGVTLSTEIVLLGNFGGMHG